MAQRQRSGKATTRSAPDAPDAAVRTLDSLLADPQNRRRHPERNVEMMRASLAHVGAARSIVIDEDDLILAGNGVTEAARAAGIANVRIVEASGDELIAVRRRGLTPEQKRALALYDNRTAELAEWNVEQLGADAAQALDLAAFFTDEELAKVLGPVAPGSFKSVDVNIETHYCCPSCGYRWSGKPDPSAPATPEESPL